MTNLMLPQATTWSGNLPLNILFGFYVPYYIMKLTQIDKLKNLYVLVDEQGPRVAFWQRGCNFKHIFLCWMRKCQRVSPKRNLLSWLIYMDPVFLITIKWMPSLGELYPNLVRATCMKMNS